MNKNLIIWILGVILLAGLVNAATYANVAGNPLNETGLAIAVCSAEHAAFPCANVNDENNATNWDTGRQESDNVTIVFNNNYTLSNMTFKQIIFNNDEGTGFIQFYNHSSNAWEQVNQTTYPSSYNDVFINLYNVTTDQIRLLVADVDLPNIQIKEWWIWGTNGTETPATDFDVNLLYPSDNDVNATPLTFTYNVSVNSGYDLDNCSLYTNQTGTWAINVTNSTPTNNSNNNFVSGTLPDGTYLWGVSCTDANGNETLSITNRTLIIDSIQPYIYANNLRLNTSAFGYWITGQINASDPNLYSVNVSINGTQIFGQDNLGLTEYQYNLSYNISGFPAGVYNLTFRAADGHTAKELWQDYDYSNGLLNNYLKFKVPGNQILITAKDGSLFDNFDAIRKYDRYSFEYEPNDKVKSEYTFIVTSTQHIDIIEDESTKYKTWLVSGNNWIDFFEEAYPDEIPKIKRINANEVEVTIKNKGGDKLIFNSIGDLNINEQTFLFYKYTATSIYTDKVFEGSSNTFKLNITRNNSYISVGTGTITYNNTLYNASVDINTDSILLSADIIAPDLTDVNSTLIGFNWSFNVTSGGIVDYFNTTTQYQNVSRILVDNCSEFSTVAVNFTMIQDDTNQTIAATMNAYLELNVTGVGLSYFNISYTASPTHLICIDPSSANYSAYAQIEYDSVDEGFEPKTYYLSNAYLDNETDYINLYLTPNATDVTFTVTDQNDNTVSDVYIYILKYDFGTNSHTTNSIIKTDSYGEAIGQIILTTQWYKFILVKDGTTVLTTDPLKITTTSRNFRISLTENDFQAYDDLREVQANLTFTNSTKNFAYSFIVPSGLTKTGCLRVVQRGANAEVLINETCVTSSAATILVNIGTETADKTYVATAYIHGSPQLHTHTLAISFAEGYKKWGYDGILLTSIVRMALALIGIWNPIVAIIMVVLGDIMMITFGLFYMNWTVLMGYIVLAAVTIWRLNNR